MEKRTSKIKTWIVGVLTVLIIFVTILSAVSGQERTDTVLEGHYLFHVTDYHSLDVDLSGQWEFYPDVLLYSGAEASDEYHAVGSEGALQAYVPEMVSVPDRWLGNHEHTIPKSGNASYRLVIDDFSPVAGHSNIVISLNGLLQEYAFYINGKQASVRIPSPTGYPVYAIDEEGQVEIVIELKNSTTGLTITPKIWAIGVHIGAMDAGRNFLLIIVTLFFILFIMFLIFSLGHESHRLRPAAVLGILLTILLLGNTIWATGYMDSINRMISSNVLSFLCLILRLAVLGWGIWSFHILYPKVLGKRRALVCESIFFSAAVFHFIAVFSLHWCGGWILAYVIAGASICIWLYTAVCGLYTQLANCLEYVIVLLPIFGATALSGVFDWQPDKKYLLYGLPCAAVCLIAWCFVSYYRYQREALIRTRELLEIERYARRTQTAMLSSQIQPHFLYNTLLTIQELCRFDPQEASRVIVRFSDYLRHNIDFMNYSELMPFEKEEKHIDNYIYIQEARFQDKLTFTSDIVTRDFQIPPLTVQPLIENAIKYGVRSRLDGGFVHLSVYEDTAGIHIVVRNSGDGFDPDQIREDHSLGNIRTRLRTLLNAFLTIGSQEGKEGTVVEIFIPAKNIVRSQERLS